MGTRVQDTLEPLGTVGSGRIRHAAIEADNLTAVRAWQGQLDGTADMVYLDPPYNTGRNLTYADRRNTDEWVAGFRAVAQAAHDLLTDSGVVVVAIGDQLHHHVRLTLDDVFGAANFISNLVWAGGASSLSSFTTGGIDYMLVYAKRRAAHKALGKWVEPSERAAEVLSVAANFWDETHDPSAASTRMKQWWKRNRDNYPPGLAMYDLYTADGRLYRTSDIGGTNGLTYDIPHPTTGLPVKNPKNGWRATRETMRAWIREGRVVFGPDHTYVPEYRRFLDEHTLRPPAPVFTAQRKNATYHVDGILGEHRFDHPKDHHVLARWIRMLTPPDGLIVDLYAGSGSTLEAVLRLNERDASTRTCICVTTNEVSPQKQRKLRADGVQPGTPDYEQWGVFRHVLQPRIETIITGTRPDGTPYTDTVDGLVQFSRISPHSEST